MTHSQQHGSRIRFLTILIVVLFGGVALAGCIEDTNGTAAGSVDLDKCHDPDDVASGAAFSDAQDDRAVGAPTVEEAGRGVDGGPITIAIPGGWLGEELRSYMLEKVIEEELDYEVEITANVEAGLAYQSVADGDTHIFVGSWLPIQREHLASQPEGSIVRIGHNLPPGEVDFGLAVPKYVYDAGVTSIADLAEHADRFNREIIGFEEGAGMMITAHERVGEWGIYGLDDWSIVGGSTPGMLATYDDAVAAGDWVVTMAWQPHFMYVKWSGDQQMVDLEDPGWEVEDRVCFLYLDGAVGSTVETLVPAGFEDDYPDVATLLKRFQVPIDHENALMLEVEEGGEPRDVARAYVDNNPDIVRTWFGH